MSKVKIRCPSCLKLEFLDLTEEISNKIKNSKVITSMFFEKNQICEHNFICYIDSNLAVRDCYMADFQIELPNINIKPLKEENKKPDFETSKVDLLKINIIPNLLSHILRGCFLKSKILLIISNKLSNELIYSFFNYIFQDSFKIDILISSEEDYIKNKKNYEDFLILSKNRILDNQKKIEKSEKSLKVERSIVQKFYDEFEPNFSLIFLKNEIHKAYMLSKSIIDFVQSSRSKDLQKKLILDHLTSLYKVKINIDYLDFLIEIVENYFGFELHLESNISTFLKFL